MLSAIQDYWQQEYCKVRYWSKFCLDQDQVAQQYSEDCFLSKSINLLLKGSISSHKELFSFCCNKLVTLENEAIVKTS